MKIYRISQENIQQEFDLDYGMTLQDLLSEKEYDIEMPLMTNVVRQNNLKYETFKNQILKVTADKDYWFERYDDNTLSLINIEQWLADLSDEAGLEFLGITENDLYVWDIGRLGDIRENPGKVYHYTTEDSWEGIKEDGFMKGGFGTGFNNTFAHGIFVSMDPEEHASGTYGNVLLTIDLDKFKAISGLPELNIDLEPDVLEKLIKEVVASELGIQYTYESIDLGSERTLIIGHNIPINCIEGPV